MVANLPGGGHPYERDRVLVENFGKNS